MDFAQKKTPGKKKAKKISETYLHNAGLYYLQRFAASREQFRAVMLRKIKRSCLQHPDQDFDTCRDMLESLLAKFVESGLLNDDLYTQGAVASLRRQGKSKKVISTKMKIRGIPGSIVEKKLEEYDAAREDDGDAIAALLFLRRKKAGPFALSKNSEPEKILASLARAGFSYETARYVLNMPLESALEMTGGSR